MKRKRQIIARKIKRWKAHLTVDGYRITKGVHYDKVYAHVASWKSISLLLTMIVLHNWNTEQIDYVQAFPQAPAEKDLYLTVPAGFEVEGGNKGEYALKLQKNVFGNKQTDRVWYKYLTKKLTEELGFDGHKFMSVSSAKGR